MGTTTIYLIKDTALASAIGTPELLRIGQLIAVETFRPVETLTIVAVLYFVVTYPVALLIGRMERRFKVARDLGELTASLSSSSTGWSSVTEPPPS